MTNTASAPDSKCWHAETDAESLARLNSQPAGLDSSDALLRLAEFGPNRLTAKK
jgi:hypothetical protein